MSNYSWVMTSLIVSVMTVCTTYRHSSSAALLGAKYLSFWCMYSFLLGIMVFTVFTNCVSPVPSCSCDLEDVFAWVRSLQPDVACFSSLRVSWLSSWSVVIGGPWQWAVSNASDQASAPMENVVLTCPTKNDATTTWSRFSGGEGCEGDSDLDEEADECVFAGDVDCFESRIFLWRITDGWNNISCRRKYQNE